MNNSKLKRNLNFDEKLLLIIEIGKKFGVKKLLLFGSSLEKPDSANDIDIAVDIDDSLFFKFASKVEREIRSPIDVVPIEANSSFIEYIERHSRVLI